MRFVTPITALALVALVGCASPQQKQAAMVKKAERQMRDENTRTTEHLRMVAVEDGEVNSSRGASILYPDYGSKFDPNRYTSNAMRSFDTKGAKTKDYNSGQPFRVDKYATKDFYGSKPNAAAEKKYTTAAADTKGAHVIPNKEKAFGTKTAATKELWDAKKAAPVNELADGHRPYLGKESKKLNQAVPAATLANSWQNAGENVIYTDSTIEKVSTMKPLSIQDIRDLLNKSK